MAAKRKYNISVIPENENRQVYNDSAYIEFINQGNTTAYIQGVRLYPSQSWSPSDNTDPETIDDTSYYVTFDQTGIVSPVNRVMVVRKKYQQ